MNFNNEDDLYNFFKFKKFNKIFVITGFNSYNKSGAKNILNKVLEKKKLFFYFKKNFFPDILELKDIIFKTNQFKPDLILAVGGGSVIDYAKITNVFKTSDNINEDILRSNFKNLKKYTNLQSYLPQQVLEQK